MCLLKVPGQISGKKRLFCDKTVEYILIFNNQDCEMWTGFPVLLKQSGPVDFDGAVQVSAI